jgi:hypothetical protein
MDLLRHGGMGRLFTDVRAPSTLGGSCGCSSSATSANSTRSPPGYWAGSPLQPRSCPAPTRSRSWISTTPCAAPTGTPSRAPGAATPGSTGSRAAGHDQRAAGRAADRRHPAAQGCDELGARRREAACRRAGARFSIPKVCIRTRCTGTVDGTTRSPWPSWRQIHDLSRRLVAHPGPSSDQRSNCGFARSRAGCLGAVPEVRAAATGRGSLASVIHGDLGMTVS